jgi:hypothetical protein
MKFTRSSIGFGSEPFENRRMVREPVQHKNRPIEIRDCFPRFHPHFRHAGRHVSKENPLRKFAFPPFCEAHDRLTRPTIDLCTAGSVSSSSGPTPFRQLASLTTGKKTRHRALERGVTTLRPRARRRRAPPPATRNAHRARSGLILDLPATSPSSPSLDSLAVRALGRV